MLEVFRVFLRLGLTSFGGPIAHLGYFRDEFVTRRQWLDEAAFADLVGLCQFLPGPASSQVGFAIGLFRAGLAGALAAWCGFTLPSAAIMALLGLGAGRLTGSWGLGLLHGLKLVAVAIVAQAVWGMARSLCPDRPRAAIGLAATLIILFGGSSLAQLAAIGMGAVLGYLFCRGDALISAPPAVVHRKGLLYLAVFVILLIGLPLAPFGDLSLFERFYRSGAMVFGGGHVVLPLLREAFVTPGLLSDDAFLAGYGAAQAMPGPLFSFAAYLGAVLGGVKGAVLGLIGIFLPGILILLAALPVWRQLRQRIWAQAAMRGVNASVVGLLGATLYTPLWTGNVVGGADFAMVLTGFILLTVWRAPPLLVVMLGAAGGFVAYLP